MPPADAAPAADRSEPSLDAPAPTTGDRRAPTTDERRVPTDDRSAPVSVDRLGQRSGVVPPPRPAPDEESDPVAPEVEDAPTEPAGAGTAERAGAEAAEPAPATGSGELTERELRILAFEQQWWKHAGAKEQAIRDTFGLSATRYYQLLNGLLDRPAALAAEPLLIGRLRRLRSSRARNRRR